jgi:hypothetical protein
MNNKLFPIKCNNHIINNKPITTTKWYQDKYLKEVDQYKDLPIFIELNYQSITFPCITTLMKPDNRYILINEERY